MQPQTLNIPLENTQWLRTTDPAQSLQRRWEILKATKKKEAHPSQEWDTHTLPAVCTQIFPVAEAAQPTRLFSLLYSLTPLQPTWTQSSRPMCTTSPLTSLSPVPSVERLTAPGLCLSFPSLFKILGNSAQLLRSGASFKYLDLRGYRARAQTPPGSWGPR